MANSGYGDDLPYGEGDYKGDKGIPFISNYVTRARNLIVEQFEDSELFLKIIDTFSVQIQELENVIFDIRIKRYLSIATGAQLDGIGDIVGERRKGRNDSDYKIALNFRIFINGSYGQMNTLSTFLSQSLSPSESFTIKENYPAAIDVVIKSVQPQFLSNSIFKSVDGLAAGGVKVHGFVQDLSGNGKIIRTVEISSDGSGDLILPPTEDTGTVSEGALGSYPPSEDTQGKIVENILT